MELCLHSAVVWASNQILILEISLMPLAGVAQRQTAQAWGLQSSCRRCIWFESPKELNLPRRPKWQWQSRKWPEKSIFGKYDIFSNWTILSIWKKVIIPQGTPTRWWNTSKLNHTLWCAIQFWGVPPSCRGTLGDYHFFFKCLKSFNSKKYHIFEKSIFQVIFDFIFVILAFGANLTHFEVDCFRHNGT